MVILPLVPWLSAHCLPCILCPPPASHHSLTTVIHHPTQHLALTCWRKQITKVMLLIKTIHIIGMKWLLKYYAQIFLWVTWHNCNHTLFFLNHPSGTTWIHLKTIANYLLTNKMVLGPLCAVVICRILDEILQTRYRPCRFYTWLLAAWGVACATGSPQLYRPWPDGPDERVRSAHVHPPRTARAASRRRVCDPNELIGDALNLVHQWEYPSELEGWNLIGVVDRLLQMTQKQVGVFV